MAYKEYTAEEYTEACRLLLEMRDNCRKSYGKDEYSDPLKDQKAKALEIALDAIDRINWKHAEKPHFGTYEDPIPYTSGMMVFDGLCYTDGDSVLEAIRDGVPYGFYDNEYLDYCP